MKHISQVSESSVLQIGNEIFEVMEHNIPSFFNTHNLRGKMLDIAMKNSSFKTALFRFIDTLPTLKSNTMVAKVFAEYMEDVNTTLPHFIQTMLPENGVFAAIEGKVLRANIETLAKTFIAGETPKEVMKFIRKIRKEGRAFTVDLLGEAVLSDLEAKKYRDRYLALVDTVREETRTWQTNPLLDFDSGRRISPAEVSLKMTSFYSRINPVNFQGTLNALISSLEPVFDRAKGEGNEAVGVTFDMEHYQLKELTLKVFESITGNFPDSSEIGIAIQAYLFDSGDDIQQILNLAAKRKQKITVRLVKGAYWDYETTTRKRDGQPLPLFTNKFHTDANFEHLTGKLLENTDIIRPAIATHNVRSAAYTIAKARLLELPPDAFEFQALYGMAEPLKTALTKLGYRVRDYVPMGKFIPGMAYFVRRLLENSSNESFLRSTYVEKNRRDVLLQKPEAFHSANTNQNKNNSTNIKSSLKSDFHNFPLPDLTVQKNRSLMQNSIDKIRKKITQRPFHIPIIVAYKIIKSRDKIKSIDPSEPERIVAVAEKSDLVIAQKAVEAATAAATQWSQTPVKERAAYLFKAADYMEENFFDLAALELFEAAKNRNEACGDVAEAIDFLRYYAKRMIELGLPQKTGNYPGEENTIEYIAKGVAVVLPPWNFPLAILTGMSAAALVSGNTVILKPSSLTPATGFKLVEAFQYAGLPPGVLNFLPGPGDLVGAFLCKHPQVDLIAFTGSIQTANNITKNAGLKKIVAETGGKNAILFDDTADPDEAASGIIASFSGYQGQKCSACSRLIVLESRYEEIIDRIIHILENIPMGSVLDPVNIIGPVIDKSAVKKINKYIAIGKKEAKLCYFSNKVPPHGFYVSPVVFRDVPSEARIANEEIFGPVLAIMKVKNIKEAVRLANQTPFALTGGLYSRSPRNIEYVRKNFNVGNLYINRKITGALVNRQPFGGFQMSGLGTKAGGAEYLYHFTNPKVISENTIRRGFAPEEDSEHST